MRVKEKTERFINNKKIWQQKKAQQQKQMDLRKV